MPAPKDKQTFYTIRIGDDFHDVTGRKRTPAGYIALCIKTHPQSDKVNGYIFEHRVVVEMSLGRYLEQNEVVHHKNEIKHDNRLVNLDVMDHGAHTIMHNTGSKRSEETKAKISLLAKERFKNRQNHPGYKHIDKKVLKEFVEKFGPTEAAKQLGVTRKTIYNKLEQLGKEDAI